MAMAEWPRQGRASYHNPNNDCQEVGNSILLILGLIICVNIGINVVILLWSRLRVVLHRMFHIICEKETKSSPAKTPTLPLKKQSSPEVHLRCTMDPVKMTVNPPPTRNHRHAASPLCRFHHLVAWTSDTDDEKLPPQNPAICFHHWDGSKDREVFQHTQDIWDSWTQDTPELPPHTICFQPTIGRKPLKTEFQSEQGLEAYVYPVNPPPPCEEAMSHTNNGAGTEAEAAAQGQPAPSPFLGPAIIPEINRHRSSGKIVYDAQDVRRRLRELTREVEALSHCYPFVSRSSTAEGTGKDWVYHSVTGR